MSMSKRASSAGASSAVDRKRARTEGLSSALDLKHRLPAVSQSALASLISILRLEGLPKEHHRWQMRAARDKLCTKDITIYGPLHQCVHVATKDGKTKAVEVQHPCAMLYVSCKQSQWLSHVVQEALQKHPCSLARPWNIILYNDEVTPGNPLAAEQKRKSEVFYWSVLEFGAHVLSNELAWMDLCSLKSTERMQFQAGVSGLFSCLLQQAFFDPGKVDVSRAGICLELFDGSFVHVWLTLGFVLADEAALHMMFLFKGSSGLKPCSLCTNVFLDRLKQTRAITSAHHGIEPVSHTCVDQTKFRRLTPQVFRNIMRRLATAKTTMEPDEFKKLEMALGWSYVPGSVTAEASLQHIIKPWRHIFYDWMHSLFQGGVFNKHIMMMLQALKKFKIQGSTIYAYVKQWHWPKYVGNKTGIGAFSAKRLESSARSGAFKCQASEGRSLCPVLAKFAMASLVQHPNAMVRKHGACFVMLADFVSLLEKCAWGTVTKDELHESYEKYLKHYQELYGSKRMTFKFHMNTHLADQLAYVAEKLDGAGGFIPNCTVLERKHIAHRQFSNINLNARSFSRSVLRDMTAKHLHLLKMKNKDLDECCLVNPSQPSTKVRQWLLKVIGVPAEVLVSTKVKLTRFDTAAVGDVVLCEKDGEHVAAILQLNASFQLPGATCSVAVSFLKSFKLLAVHDKFSEWDDTGDQICIPSTSVLKPCIWSKTRSKVVILTPIC